ncbi:hypothetical protein ACGFSG_26370 [Streptomyces sp. NPDC048512]|uniref:hypothetical protein n=1 Tax=Streptomyces sp. NPDC048512 TaxID=3365563 RepID=UPI0037145249
MENGVLVLAPQDGLRAEAADTLAALIADPVEVHAPMPAVIVVGAGTNPAAVDAVVRAHRMCRPTGVLLSVAAACASTRRLLRARAAEGGRNLVVHARTDIAITTACATGA